MSGDKSKRNKLTVDQQSFIDANWLKMTYREIAEEINVEKYMVKNYQRKMKRRRPRHLVIAAQAKSRRGRTSFTAEEDKYIRENYLTMPIKTLAKKIDRSGFGVKGRLEAMGLKIPRHIVEQRKKDSRIKKGQVPPSKGKKQTDYMSPDAIAKTTKTRFKKGNTPINTLHDGAISIRINSKGYPYKYIRLSQGRWQFLSRYVWEKHTGETLNRNEIITFRDGDTLNCNIENLEKITKAEILKRNQYNIAKGLSKDQARRALQSQIRNIISLKIENNEKHT